MRFRVTSYDDTAVTLLPETTDDYTAEDIAAALLDFTCAHPSRTVRKIEEIIEY